VACAVICAVASRQHEFETGRQAAIEEREPLEPRAGLARDIVDELRWTWAGRKGWLLGMLGNLVFAIGYLFVTDYDPHVSGDIKVANVGLAVVLWCLADPINTNQLGNDSERVVNSLRAGDSVGRILAIKNIALAVLLLPFALLISTIHWLIAGRFHLVPHTVVADFGAVFLWMGVGSVVSVLLPYPPLKIRSRVKALLARKSVVRYAACLAAPYVLWLGIVKVLHIPYNEIWDHRLLGGRVADVPKYGLVYLGLALVYWVVGLLIAEAYDRRFPGRLIRDLEREV
jgi:hypothetical protein